MLLVLRDVPRRSALTPKSVYLHAATTLLTVAHPTGDAVSAQVDSRRANSKPLMAVVCEYMQLAHHKIPC